MGSHGMPRRYYNYLERFTAYHQASTVGSMVVALGFFIMAGYLLHSLVRGEKAPANPWGGATLEWETSSPPPYYNFAHEMHAGDPYDIDALHWDPAIQGYVRRDPASVLASGGEAG
jgi:cytochrome c oxidase subunit 1